jgi:hypothetical protein
MGDSWFGTRSGRQTDSPHYVRNLSRVAAVTVLAAEIAQLVSLTSCNAKEGTTVTVAPAGTVTITEPGATATATEPAVILPTEQPTEVPTEVPTPTPTKEAEPVLGGPEVRYNFYSSDKQQTMPEALKKYLVPSPPETWKESGLTYADGTPVPWGKPVIMLGQNGNLYLFVPSLVRGFGEAPAPSFVGGVETYVVVESPAFGGSNFMIIPYNNKSPQQNPAYEIINLPGGQVPDIWREGTFEKPLDGNTFNSTYTFKGQSTAKEVVQVFKQNTGVFLFLGYEIAPNDKDIQYFKNLASNKLLTPSTQSTRFYSLPSYIFVK